MSIPNWLFYENTPIFATITQRGRNRAVKSV